MVDGTEAVLNYGALPYVAITMGTTTEILMKSIIDRGTTGPSDFEYDVIARTHIFPHSFLDIGLAGTFIDLKMTHAALGGALPGELYLLAGHAGAGGSALSSAAFVGDGLGDTFTVWTRIRIEPKTGTSSWIRANAWIDGTTEPGGWMAEIFGAQYDLSMVVEQIHGLVLAVDNTEGATDTIFRIDSICFIEGIGCGPPDGAEINNEDGGLGDGSTTSYSPRFSYKVGSLVPAIDGVPQLDADTSDGTNVIFTRAPETDEQVSFMRYVRAS